MKAVALKSTSESAPARKQQKAVAHPVSVPSLFVQTAPVDGALVQRKSTCACGGGCPSCQEDSHHPGIQTKLTINTPGDQYEQEADRVAEQVLAKPAHPAVDGVPPRIQRFTAQATGQAEAAPASVDQVLAGPGRALEPVLRQDMEHRFGHDFSRVQVHSGAAAEQSAQDVNAHAYTMGHNIVFGAGQFAPRTYEGRRLIAHELTHVVQQRGNGGATDSASLKVQRQLKMKELPPIIPGPTLMMAKPLHFPQPSLTCWASAIASFQRVKGLSGTVTDSSMIAHYRGTDCVHEDGTLKNAADIEAVFAEWRILMSISAEIQNTATKKPVTFQMIKSLIQKHGHFVIFTKDKALMHSMVVYGVKWNDQNDPTNFTLYVEDPMQEANEIWERSIEWPIRFGLGTEKSAGPAPCRSRTPPPKEK